MSQNTSKLADNLINFTQRYLTFRKKRRAIDKMLTKKKNFLRDWLEAFLWAAMVVLVVNQYFIQAYFIPSGSMEKTLNIGDRIFVDKLSYGPELLPGFAKLPGWDTPSRGEIISFVNPDNESRGTLFTIVQRTLYMLTLSLVDLDTEEKVKNEGGGKSETVREPRKSLLIKRVIGEPNEEWRMIDGVFEIKTPDEGWVKEPAFKAQSNYSYTDQRVVSQSDYGIIKSDSYDLNRKSLGKEFDQFGMINGIYTPIYLQFEATKKDPQTHALFDSFTAYERLSLDRFKFIPQLTPDRNLSLFFNGIFVPEGYVLPLGDNRDNSKDGRYFGPVKKSDILGKAQFRFWTFDRFGTVK